MKLFTLSFLVIILLNNMTHAQISQKDEEYVRQAGEAGNYLKACERMVKLEPTAPHAQTYLAYCLRDVKGIKQDNKRAVFWLRKAARQGYGDAQFDLSYHYAEGLGVVIDLVMAYAWVAAARANGASQSRTYGYDQEIKLNISSWMANTWDGIEEVVGKQARIKANKLAVQCFEKPSSCPNYSH